MIISPFIYESTYVAETTASSVKLMPFLRLSSKVVIDVCTFGDYVSTN